MRYPGAVHSSDVVASALVLGSCAAFAVGSSALARAQDLTAIYWLAVGFLAVRSALSVVRARTE